MKKLLLLFVLLLVGLGGHDGLLAQAFTENFDGDNTINGTDNVTVTKANGEVTLTGNGATGPYEAFTYNLKKDGAPTTLDITSTSKLFIRAKTSAVGTKLRVDIRDDRGFVTTIGAITRSITADYTTLEYDFGGKFAKGDGGYGGTACTADTKPCDIDPTKVTDLLFTIDPAVGGFEGTIVIDYIAFVTDPNAGAANAVFADQLNNPDSTLGSFVNSVPGYSLRQTGEGEVVVTGDGTIGEYDPFAYVFRNQTSFEDTDIDFTEGKNKLYIKMKSTKANTNVRVDAQDGDNFITTGASLSKLVGTEYAVYEYNFTGGYTDLGYGGTACNDDTKPCPVDGKRVVSLVWFINPGSGAFAGDLTIDWISVGAPLESLGPKLQLTYFDRFNDGQSGFQNTESESVTLSETNSEFRITSDGTSSPYTAITYTLHDKDSQTATPTNVGASGNKLYVRMKVEGPAASVRIDAVDTKNVSSTKNSFAAVVTAEYETYEIDFTGSQDAGYGGSGCPDGTTCDVRLDSLAQLFFYVNPNDGGYNGTLVIDYLSFGQELGPDGPSGAAKGVTNFADQFNDSSLDFLGTVDGFTTSSEDGVLTLTGDGTSGTFAVLRYYLNNGSGDSVLVDAAGSNNKLYVRAKASAPVKLRVDLADVGENATTNGGVTNDLTTEYQTLEYDFSGKYQDGGYGGTGCTAGPCAVDGERINRVDFYVAPAAGGFNGTVDIDYISFGNATPTSVNAPRELADVRVSPNPTTGRLRVDYALVVNGDVSLSVYDGIGRQVMHQVQGQTSAGIYSQELSLEVLPQGLYQVVLSVDGYVGKTATIVKQ